MINKVILVGNVGNDPEVRYVSEGVAVARFSLATSESYTNKQGEKVENTEWHNLVAWRGLAKIIEDYVTKGVRLYVEGKITYRTYEKDGETKYFTEIIVNELKILTRKSEVSGSPAPQAGKQAQQAPAPIPSNIYLIEEERDYLPF